MAIDNPFERLLGPATKQAGNELVPSITARKDKILDAHDRVQKAASLTIRAEMADLAEPSNEIRTDDMRQAA